MIGDDLTKDLRESEPRRRESHDREVAKALANLDAALQGRERRDDLRGLMGFLVLFGFIAGCLVSAMVMRVQ